MRHAAAPRATGVAHARSLSNAVFRLTYRLHVAGLHHVPTDGPVLLAGNHLGFLDGPLLVACAPRPVHVLAKSEIFQSAWGPLVQWAGQVELDYTRPDRRGLQEALTLLEHGAAVGVFPEGHRGRGDVASIRRGLAYLVARSGGVPVVPVAFLGTRHTGGGANYVPPPGSRIAVHFGAPWRLHPSGGELTDASLTAMTTSIQEHLRAHVRQTVARTGISLPEDAAVED